MRDSGAKSSPRRTIEMDRLGVPYDIVIGHGGLTAVPSERAT
ncbi:hypothetical protein [Nocardia niwae]|uniref:Uncharacterized protein n=1 Tax=Nocardia niwae TaxID=626084 RepID=A0ABV2XHC0_9NOCA|nr:hypothetical protein [Nocardia niwae]